MMLEEASGKKVLRHWGLRAPHGVVATTAEDACLATQQIGPPVVVKAQVPAGGRGKAGGVVMAKNPQQALVAAQGLLGSWLSGFRVDSVLVEQHVEVARELYVAVLDDARARCPSLLFSGSGGIDIEALDSDQILQIPLDIRSDAPIDTNIAGRVAQSAGIEDSIGMKDVLSRLYACYRDVDAQLVEVNPLAIDTAGGIWALDCKMALDEAALKRQPEWIVELASTVQVVSSELEAEAATEGLLYMELDGAVGVLANGAGLTMATLDAISYYGGAAANFLEVGGENYTRAESGTRIVLSNPKVKSLLVNFCGAFARTDVMTEGVVKALEQLKPSVPVFFSVHGTGEKDAVALLDERLGIKPYEEMDDAVRAAVAAATLEPTDPQTMENPDPSVLPDGSSRSHSQSFKEHS
ncbi:MAG: acetate--CoA ligase family protein [Actinobacteria bacterium]|nr:acetate--CoA ligase family protein [Actinomycetota bacterium]